MNPSLLFHFFTFFTAFTTKSFSFPTQTISYPDHCNSYVPEAIPTDTMFTRLPLLDAVTTNYTGGQNILDQDTPTQRSLLFEATRNLYRTNVVDTYKIQARLSFYASHIYHPPSNNINIGSNYSRVGRKQRHTLVFQLDGFWSASTSKLCMVGSARWLTKEGNPLELNAILKLKLAQFMNLNNSLVSGILESLVSADNFNYFDPISILGFPQAAHFKYNYTMASNEDCNVTITKNLHDSITSMKSLEICSIFIRRFITYKLEYPSNCHNCSLFGQDNGYLPTFVSLYVIQCSRKEQKLRFLVEFLDRRFTPYDQSFRADISLIGEGTWNGRKDELCIVACPILNQSDPLGSARVGDCSIRLSLWFLKVWSITKTHTTEGQIWTTKFTDDLGSFRMAKFQSLDHSRENYGSKYEYTQIEKVRHACPKKKRVGYKYESGFYGFDMLVKHKKMVSRGSAVTVFMGNQGLNHYTKVNRSFDPWEVAVPPAADVSTGGPQNITFEITFMLNTSTMSRSGISSLYLSSTDNDRVEISAEGVYDDETGQICMVGCRNLKNISFDCEILVKIQLPQLKKRLIRGSIESLREKNDVLYFENLNIVSVTYTETEARESIWRMDLEIIMVLISGTLMCLFTRRQLLYLKKRHEMVGSLSILMMLILTLGNMVPLVLNFEAMFPNTGNKQIVPIRSNGLLEVNEVIVRIVILVAFILQFRLLRLTWIARKGRWIHEIRTLFICLPIYIIGGSTILLVKWRNDNDTISSQFSNQQSIWGDLRSYAGLTLDGFLFPQLILNIFRVSKGNALSYSFYIGTTFVRLLPHVFDLYRGQKSISHQFDKLYIYANPRADFYSLSWDVIIVCGGLAFAVIVFLQQRFGGRFMFPKRFQEHVEYEIVPVKSNE